MVDQVVQSWQSDFPRTCTGTFTKNMGMPCAHRLLRLVKEEVPVTHYLVYRHWSFPGRYMNSNVVTDSSAAVLFNRHCIVPNVSLTPAAGVPTKAMSNNQTYDAPKLKHQAFTTNASNCAYNSRSSLLDLATVKPQGRPRCSTRRDMSVFETVASHVCH